MSERSRFRPAMPEDLEARVPLSAGLAIAPAPVSRPHVAPRVNRNQAIVAALNQSYDAFTTDYLQAQGTYMANGATPPAHLAFTHYVDQRIKLLSAQLTQVFVQVPGSLRNAPKSSPGGPVVVQNFLRTYINGPAPTTLLEALEGRRGGGAIPPPGTTGPSSTLYTDQAISAIATARTISTNSVGFLVSHSFQPHH